VDHLCLIASLLCLLIPKNNCNEKYLYFKENLFIRPRLTLAGLLDVVIVLIFSILLDRLLLQHDFDFDGPFSKKKKPIIMHVIEQLDLGTNDFDVRTFFMVVVGGIFTFENYVENDKFILTVAI
jgi:hypothetical protein